MKWGYAKHALTTYARTFDRSAVLMPHSHWFWRAVLFVGFWIPRGKFAQTIGPLVGIPDDWTIEAVRSVIPHEVGGHVRQFRWFGLWIHPWAGLPLMALVYGLLFFPVFLAYFRYRLELHADSVKWRTRLAEGQSSPSDVMHRAQRFADTVASWTYLKPWPAGLVKRGFVRAAKRVIEEHHATR
jgi:hypothetical protein